MSALARRAPPAPAAAGECVLVWAPHPDDEVLAAGMLIQRALARGARVHVTIATDGDNQSWAQRIVEHRWRIRTVDRRRWGARRRDEALAGLRALGVGSDAVRFLGVPDRSVTAGLLATNDPIVTTLADDLERVRPTLLVVPALEDRHPDHSALAVAAQLALERSPVAAPALLRYLIHGPGLAGRTLRLAAGDGERVRKHDALLCHRSQIAVHRRRLLAFVEREEFAWIDAGAPAAGATHPVRDLVRLRDAVRVRVALPRTRRHATLRLRAGADAASRIACAIPLPATTGPVTIGGAGGPHRAWCWRSGTHLVAVIPVPPPATSRRWFAKLDVGDRWFDRAGWREFPAVRQQGGTESGPHPETTTTSQNPDGWLRVHSGS